MCLVNVSNVFLFYFGDIYYVYLQYSARQDKKNQLKVSMDIKSWVSRKFGSKHYFYNNFTAHDSILIKSLVIFMPINH